MPGNGRRKTDCGVNTMDRSERMRKSGTMREKPLGTKGALLYMVCDHVVRPSPAQEPPRCGGWPPKRLAAARCTELHRLQHPNVESGCVTYVPYKGLHPLRSSSQSPFNSVSTLRRKLRSLPCSSFSPQNRFCGDPLSLSLPK